MKKEVRADSKFIYLILPCPGPMPHATRPPASPVQAQAADNTPRDG